MKEKFNIKRFWNYFCFDLKHLWHNHNKTPIILASVMCLFQFLITMGIYKEMDTEPMLEDILEMTIFRLVMMFCMILAMSVFIARVYGFVTERKEGGEYMMLPVPVFEKWLSMMVICLIVLPLASFITFLTIDGVLSLAYPHATSLIVSLKQAFIVFVELLKDLNGAKDIFSLFGFVLFAPIVTTFSILYFLYCGLLFRRNKISNSLLIAFALVCLVSSLKEPMAAWYAIDPVASFNTITAVIALLSAALAYRIYRRLRKLTY